MRPFLFLVIALAITQQSSAQTVTETYPKTYFCPNDTFVMKYSDFPGTFPYRVSRTDKGSPGTDARPNIYITIYYGNDSLRVPYHNKLPYAHIIFINFESPKGKTTLRLHYNDVASYFPVSYMSAHNNQVQFDIPEPYELANIIWTLSPSGQRAADLYKTGEYFQRVMAHFKPFLNHPIFKQLDFPDSVYYSNYYGFRENSFAFNFEKPDPGSKNTKLLFNGPYYFVYGEELADSSLFGKLKALVEDFAAKSKFRQFYKENLPYYSKEIDRAKLLLPMRQMWDWMEKEFPARHQSYRVVFSPLTGGSHSTQNFGTYQNNSWFSESVMFICGTGRYDEMNELTEKQREGLMSGIVFTEIDHNYVNRESYKFRQSIDSIFSNRATWTKEDLATKSYGNPISVFNEYFTHALFCLYILETYDPATAKLVNERRESLMVDRRNFIRFREFNAALIQLRKEHKDGKAVDLLPLIIEWCRTQN